MTNLNIRCDNIPLIKNAIKVFPQYAKFQDAQNWYLESWYRLDSRVASNAYLLILFVLCSISSNVLIQLHNYKGQRTFTCSFKYQRFLFDEGECQTFSWGSLYIKGRGVIDFVISDYRKMSFFAAEIWLMLTSRWKTFLLFVIKYFIFLWIIILFPASNNVTMRTLNDRLLIAASFSRLVLGRTLVKRRKKSAQISFYHLFKVPEWFRH